MNLLLDAWPHWLRPYWLLLAPLLGWLLWKLLHRQRRAGRWQLLLPTAFQPWLLVGGAGRQPVGAQPVRPGVQQQVHGCLPERRRGQVRFSR
ncbi:hypothetical protein LDY98_02775, partial [Pseudomonas aeruginosa]|nr:hypothetical protein [Pseudomonas aeruginosa]